MATSLPPQYGYVIGVGITSTLVNQWLATNVAKYRKAANVPYPNAYSTSTEAKEDKAKYLFNCAQRSHAHYLEHWPTMLVGLFAGGLKYPVAASAMGIVWLLSRIAYTLGYTRKDKTKGEGRRIGSLFYLAELGLLIAAGTTGYQLLLN